MEKLARELRDNPEMACEAIRQHLITLGWAPPDEVFELRSRLIATGKTTLEKLPPPTGKHIEDCKHCGAPALLTHGGVHSDEQIYRVECSGCRIRTISYDNPDSPIEAWNRRASCD